MSKNKRKNYAYIDGSFNPKTKVYGWGGFVIDQNGNKHIIQGCGNSEEFAKMRNVAGEIFGSVFTIVKVVSLGMKELTIYYDYDGVANWPLKKWKCNNCITEIYAWFVREIMKNGLKIHFKKVRGHAGILGNEEADRLAKEAVGIKKRYGNQNNVIIHDESVKR